MIWKVLGGLIFGIGILFSWVLRFAVFLALCIYIGFTFISNLNEGMGTALISSAIALVIGSIISWIIYMVFGFIGMGLVAVGATCFEKAERREQQREYVASPAVLSTKPRIPQTTTRLGMSVRTQRTIFVVLGILLLFFLGGLDIGFWEGLALSAIEVFLLLYGGYLWAKVKGRHWAWMLTMLFWPVGVLTLFLLKDKSSSEVMPVDDNEQ